MCLWNKNVAFYLQNYQASVDDFKRVLLIDPDVLEAKRELEEVTQLLNFDNSAVADGQQKQRKKITIQEVYQLIFRRVYRSYTFKEIILKLLFCTSTVFGSGVVFFMLFWGHIGGFLRMMCLVSIAFHSNAWTALECIQNHSRNWKRYI